MRSLRDKLWLASVNCCHWKQCILPAGSDGSWNWIPISLMTIAGNPQSVLLARVLFKQLGLDSPAFAELGFAFPLQPGLEHSRYNLCIRLLVHAKESRKTKSSQAQAIHLFQTKRLAPIGASLLFKVIKRGPLTCLKYVSLPSYKMCLDFETPPEPS